jgi:hypothetical protein
LARAFGGVGAHRRKGHPDPEPDPIPCRTSGEISSDSDETAESFHDGESLEAAALQDDAINQAFNRAWHNARAAHCGQGCSPRIDSVKIQLHSVDYEYQHLVSAMYWKPQFTCLVKFSWSAKVTCVHPQEEEHGILIPPFAREPVDIKLQG